MQKAISTSELIELQAAFDRLNGVTETNEFGRFQDAEDYSNALFEFNGEYINGDEWDNIYDYIKSCEH